MASRTSSIERHPAGFSLVEMLMAVGVGSMVLASVMVAYVYSSRCFAATANYVDLDRKSQIAMDHLTQQIRQVNQLTAFSSTNLTFQDFDGQTLKFNYDPAQKTLTRVKTNQTVVYLQDLASLNFLIYQHYIQSGTFDAVSNASVAATNCKLVEISWLCSRNVLGQEANTESLRSAKIAIRKKQGS